MKLKIKPKKRKTEFPKEEISVKSSEKVSEKSSEKKSGRKNSLPPDEYEPIFEPLKVKLREYTSEKSGEKVEQYLIMKVMRNNYDNGKVYFYMTMWQDSKSYTGFMKGKTVFFPVTRLDDVIGFMCQAINDCETVNLIEEELENENEG